MTILTKRVGPATQLPEQPTDRLQRARPELTVYEGWQDRLHPGRRLDGYIGPLALLSDAPASLFGRRPDWARCAEEAMAAGVLEPVHVQNVERVLQRRGIAHTARLVTGGGS